jgi:glycosyltransferase involved in cell wall biosynthesis
MKKLTNYLKKIIIKIITICLVVPIFIVSAYIVAICIRYFGKKTISPRLVWGSTPIISNSYWAKAMRLSGFESETFTTNYYSTINKRSDWDRILDTEFKFFWNFIKPYIAFVTCLVKYDVFFISFDGFFLGHTMIRKLQASILKLAHKKIVVLPYGGDSYSYQSIRSTSLLHGLMMSYPLASKKQMEIKSNVDYWCEYADVVVPGIMGPDGFGRWDILTPSFINIDLELWLPSTRSSTANGITEIVYIAHAPNHRGFKGTEFIISAVESLKKEGLLVELILLEKIQNEEVRNVLSNYTDILVEQLIFTGYALNAIEGLASGVPVISNLVDGSYTLPMRRWSYLNECPIVSATPEDVTDVLRTLVMQPSLRHVLGKAGREYAEKYHSLTAAQYMFGEMLDYLYGRRDSLINLYHPLLAEGRQHLAPVQHPLINSQIAK